MSKRPSRLLSWAYDAIAGAVVEPPGGLSAAGWAKDTRPPAPYMNFLLNVAAGWINFLRGPNLANWSRQSPITAFSDTTHLPLKMVAVDTETVDGDTAAWRYVVVGSGTGGDPVRQLWCSRRGDAWVQRTNLPVGADGTMVGVHYNANRALWFCWTTGGSGDGQIFYTPAGDSGAVGTDGVDWTASTMPGGTPDVVGVVGCNGSRIAAITVVGGGGLGILTSTDGAASFTAATLTGSFTGDGLDLVWSGQSFVALTSAEIFRSSNNVSATWARSTLPETSTRHRLATDGAGTVCVYAAGESTVQNLLVSTDHGATWETVPGFTGMKHLKRVVYGDGVWIATSSDSPYLWQSNDLVKWVRLAPPVLESGSLVPLDVVYADARWLVVGNGFTLLTSRATDPMPGTFVPNGDPPVLADAGYLRGRKIATTAPTDAQALAWNETNAQWEPATIGGGSVASTDITDSTSVGRAVLTATDAAAARAAIGVTSGAGTRIAPPFESGQGWTLVDPSSPGDGAGSFVLVSGSPVGRLTLTSAGDLHGITGPRIERALPQGVGLWKASVRLRALTGSAYVGIYVRDGSSALVVFALPNGSVARETPTWNIDGPGSAGEVSFDSTCSLAMRADRALIRSGSISAAGVWSPRSALSYFEPTHVGVILLCDGPQAATADLDTFEMEYFG